MAYFAACIFLSAFLIFQVQPMIARTILPWFGGTPAVWSTVQMFFQIVLTAGYAYAEWLTRPNRRRLAIHMGLLAISVVVIVALAFTWKSPITPDANWRPAQGTQPVWEIFKLLAVSVGLPYFLLSSNSPLIQTWFHRAFPAKTAYRLYALSNVGSLLGLVSYPILIEPFLSLAWQGWLWSGLFVLFALLVGWGAVGQWKKARDAQDIGNVIQDSATSLNEQQILEARSQTKDGKKTLFERILWIFLAMTASIFLLATTSQITQEVAVIPFLWVLPLTIYLLSFILAFSGEKWYSRQAYLVLFFASTLLAGWALGKSEDIAIGLQIVIYSVALFSACMVCHGELYRLRPHADRLASFYLLVSIGGAMGGLFIIFLAPALFKGYWELPLGFGLCWILFALVVLRKREERNRWVFVVNRVLLLSGLLFAGVRTFQVVQSDISQSLFIDRNFFGVLRVKSLGADGWPSQHIALVHGTTIHGFQYVDPERRSMPTAYFSESGGGGLAILNHPKRGSGMRVGVLGLGIGTLAAYGEAGDVYRFYEINPLVVEMAEGQNGYFSYLEDSQAEIEIALGDARLSLETEYEEGGSQEYDVLILDVFSSDSIPVHLLDREAFELYLQHLAPGGILGVHISNRHLDLVPVTWTLADHFSLERVVISDPGDYEAVFPSLWVLMSRDESLLLDPEIAARAENMDDYSTPMRLWTDDYSNLFQILR